MHALSQWASELVLAGQSYGLPLEVPVPWSCCALQFSSSRAGCPQRNQQLLLTDGVPTHVRHTQSVFHRDGACPEQASQLKLQVTETLWSALERGRRSRLMPVAADKAALHHVCMQLPDWSLPAMQCDCVARLHITVQLASPQTPSHRAGRTPPLGRTVLTVFL